MKVLEEMADDVTVLEVHGRLDSTTAKQLGSRLTALVQADRRAILVDLENIAYISSTGFHVLITANQAAAERQGRFALCGVNGEVRRLFEIGSFDELFLICRTRADGINVLRDNPVGR